MTIPRKFTPGDAISAERLNVGQAEALRSRRDISLGNGSSLVNEQLGNQSANMRRPLMRLVVAIEDFVIPETPTDISTAIDDVPSGRVRDIRLNKRTGIHSVDEVSAPTIAYDASGGLSGTFCTTASNSVSDSASGSTSASVSESGASTTSKLECDIFYIFFNEDSKRWEVVESGGGTAGEIIQFQPFEVCLGIGLTCDCVTARVATATCGSRYQPGDIIQVWDQSRGWFEMPPELLFNSVGWAHSVKITESEEAELPFPIGPCRFVVISMDCVEQD